MEGDFYKDMGRRRRLAVRIIYTNTRLDMTYAVGILSQFMHARNNTIQNSSVFEVIPQIRTSTL